MAVNIPSTAFLPRTISLGLSALDRCVIERQIEDLIALLDQIDGDCDLEDDELHDDPLDLGEPREFAMMLPVYGTDQSRGPVNEREVYAEEIRLCA